MRFVSILLFVLLLTGCATQPTVVKKEPPLRPLAASASTKFAETRYDVRSYRDAANPSLRHEAHTIYRRTQVPSTTSNELETVPRASFPPASVMPLPASEELADELATQRKITVELRAIQTAVTEAGQKMQAQYALLVRQSAEALRLKEQLEAERSRAPRATPEDFTPVAPTAMSTNNPPVKW